MTPRRVHVSQPHDVYMGRDCNGYKDVGWGNPFTVEAMGRGACIAAYERHLREMPDIATRLKGLDGLRLACWCKASEACHGRRRHQAVPRILAILVRLASQPSQQEPKLPGRRGLPAPYGASDPGVLAVSALLADAPGFFTLRNPDSSDAPLHNPPT